MKKKILYVALICALILTLAVSVKGSAYAGVKTPSGCIFTTIK